LASSPFCLPFHFLPGVSGVAESNIARLAKFSIAKTKNLEIFFPRVRVCVARLRGITLSFLLSSFFSLISLLLRGRLK
jgi:hypothetical protein